MVSYLPLLLLGDAFSAALALPQNDRSLFIQQSNRPLESSQMINQSLHLSPRSLEMDQTIASFTEQGLCFHYFAERPPSHPHPCIKYCKSHGGHGYSGCNITSYANIDIPNGDQSIISTDEDGFRWVPAPCECSNPDVEVVATSIFAAVAEGLDKIDNVLCAEWIQAFEDISNLGITSVPHGEVMGVASQAIRAAKTFAENGLGAAEFFDSWVGNVCSIPDWNVELWKALVGAPNSLGTSVGCLRDDQSNCQRHEVLSSPPATNSGTRLLEGKLWSRDNSNDPQRSGRAKNIRKGSSLIGALIWMLSV